AGTDARKRGFRRQPFAGGAGARKQRLDLAKLLAQPRVPDPPPPALRHSRLILAARPPRAPFFGFAAISRPKSALDPASTAAPSSESRATVFGSASTALISRLSAATIAAGVSLGAPMPAQIVAS